MPRKLGGKPDINDALRIATVINARLMAGAVSAAAHALLSNTHIDTDSAAVVDGDILIGDSTPKWTRLAISIPGAGLMNYVGAANGDLRPGYKALFDASVPTTIVAGDSAATGSATVAARRDHTHGAPATWPATAHNLLSATHDATPAACTRGDVITGQGASPKWTRLAINAPAAGLMNYFGAANGDAEPGYKALFDANVPTTIAAGASAATGSSTVAARRDHTHGAPATWAATAHNLLSATHGDALADSVVAGDVLIGNATPKWARLAKGSQYAILAMGAALPAWSGFLIDGTAGGKTSLAVSNTKTLTLTAIDNYNLTIPATGTAALGTGASARLAYWSGTNTLTSDADLTFDGTHLTCAGGLNLGTGSGAAAGQIQATAAAVASSAETLMTLKVSDDLSSYLMIGNGSATDSVFSARILGLNSAADIALRLYGLCTTDTGTNPAVVIDGRTAVSAALATRPLLGISNNGTLKASINNDGALYAAGALKIGTTTAPDVGYLMRIAGHIEPNADSSYDIGKSDNYFRSIYVDSFYVNVSQVVTWVSPSQITASQNNYNPGAGSWFRLTSNGDYDVTGWIAGVNGQWLHIHMMSAQTLTFKHNSGSSDPGNKFYLKGGTDKAISQYESIVFNYNSTVGGYVQY